MLGHIKGDGIHTWIYQLWVTRTRKKTNWRYVQWFEFHVNCTTDDLKQQGDSFSEGSEGELQSAPLRGPSSHLRPRLQCGVIKGLESSKPINMLSF